MVRDREIDAVAGALHVGIGLLLRRLRQTRVEGEVSLPEVAALARLDRGGPATAAALAKQEGISPQAMGATVAALQARGLVERRPDPGDGRRALLTVSAAGAEVLRVRRHARTEQLARVLESEFTDEERARLMAAAPLIERLAQGL
ncbi:MAG TPA: MarR family transcriptional regulator [Miltoncostaea sp.]|nr:MarR family transcriptional regulator [Miltoncostaea sp.]